MAITPVKNVFKGMSARAIGIIRGRMKKRRADILLPEEQVKANKETAKTDKKHTKLMDLLENREDTTSNRKLTQYIEMKKPKKV